MNGYEREVRGARMTIQVERRRDRRARRRRVSNVAALHVETDEGITTMTMEAN